MAVYPMKIKRDRDMEGYDGLNPLALECARQELTKAVKEGRVDGLEQAILVYITEAAINTAGGISNARTVGIDPTSVEGITRLTWDNSPAAAPAHVHKWYKLPGEASPPAAVDQPCYECSECRAHTHTFRNDTTGAGDGCSMCWPNDPPRPNWMNEPGVIQ